MGPMGPYPPYRYGPYRYRPSALSALSVSAPIIRPLWALSALRLWAPIGPMGIGPIGPYRP